MNPSEPSAAPDTAVEIEPGVWFWSAEVGPHRHADHLQRTAPAHAGCEPLRIFKEK